MRFRIADCGLRIEDARSIRNPKSEIRNRFGRSYWPVLAFLVGFTILLIGICHYYLFPALEAAAKATAREKKGLGAYSWLLMAIILVILIAGLMLTFRIGRFFFPRPSTPRTQTKYVDAWAESGKRMRMSDDQDEEENA